MKLSLSHFKCSKRLALSEAKGFTLIELLVVIAIIGILAAALIATIDPLEQIRKANDTTRKNTAVEYVGGITRYFGSRQAFPWNPAPLGSNCNGGAAPSNAQLSALTSCTDAMITESELKSGFKDTAAGPIGQDIRVSYIVASSRLVACFDPKSRSGDLDPAAKYVDANDTTGTCAPAVGATCMWCAQ